MKTICRVLLWTPLFAAGVAHARAAVTYSFQEGLYETAWSFEVPSLLTQTTVIPLSDLFAVQEPSAGLFGCTISQVEIVNPLGIFGDGSGQVYEGYAPGCSAISTDYGLGLNPVALDHFGTYAYGEQVLTITEVADAPEAGTAVLFSVGLFVSVVLRVIRILSGVCWRNCSTRVAA